jgi:steroid 5-alpha reductase family enzyme
MAKTWGIVLIVVGVLMLAAVLLASPLHIYGTGFGPKHVAGTIAGAVVLIVGIVLTLVSKPKPASN